MKPTLMLFFAAIVVTACGPNQRILNSANENRPSPVPTVDANSTPAARTFEQDLEAMRTADFNFIYVFRRKDGGVLDADDRAFIGRNTPAEMNRRTLSDGGKAVMIGSNFRLPDDNLSVFKERFLFEDYSKAGG
ncbi:MAG TPA: hypothetical protein VFZ23_10665 [Pyrinomonadaceae bacterium]